MLVLPRRVDILDEGTQQVIASRVQLPIIIAWALTVHRAQGLTLPCVIIKLESGAGATVRCA